METDSRKRLVIGIQGAVQGVGFRPFVYRLATTLGLAGMVKNTVAGVSIELEGPTETLAKFLSAIETEKPPLAHIRKLEYRYADPKGYRGFTISQSESAAEKRALILPDIATCRDCLAEIRDPKNRRYRYPFTNCTNCGPRFSIITALPYDRPNTTMTAFSMCDDCRDEYENPTDRRYHAQPIACPACGPKVELWNDQGKIESDGDEAIARSVELIERGMVLAIKGLGGFHLIVNAADDDAVKKLRRRKKRPDKPFAMMFPSLDTIKAICEVSPDEQRILDSPQAPIVLLNRRADPAADSIVSPAVAPSCKYLGIMLPYTPLHHILLERLQKPIVATSGNLSDEPICIDEKKAVIRLAGVADYYLVHNRRISHHVDDSVVGMVCGKPQVLRRARGFAPLPITVGDQTQTVLAVGGHLKNTVAMAVADNVFISQHIGDLETEETAETFAAVIADLGGLYGAAPEVIACDMHPEYISTNYARKKAGIIREVQHHYAHILSCMAENGISPPCLGVCWDGTGYGIDKTIWGGEFLIIDENDFRRLACFHRFKLPGGEKAVREPRRAAVGALYEIYGPDVFEQTELPPIMSFTNLEKINLARMLEAGVNSPLTSSVGRLFDAAASLCNLRQICTFEGQAAIELEYAIAGGRKDPGYELPITRNMVPITIDWRPLFMQLIADYQTGVPTGEIAARFHNALAKSIVAIARIADLPNVVLSGGCFQNRYLSEAAIDLLQKAGFRAWWHRQIPPNDGGISLGQAIAAQRYLSGRP